MVNMNETELIEYLLAVYGVFYSPTSVVIQLIMCFVAILFYIVFTITVSTTPFHLSCRYTFHTIMRHTPISLSMLSRCQTCESACKSRRGSSLLDNFRVILLANSVASFVMIIVHIIRSLVTVIELPTKFASDCQ